MFVEVAYKRTTCKFMYMFDCRRHEIHQQHPSSNQYCIQWFWGRKIWLLGILGTHLGDQGPQRRQGSPKGPKKKKKTTRKSAKGGFRVQKAAQRVSERVRAKQFWSVSAPLYIHIYIYVYMYIFPHLFIQILRNYSSIYSHGYAFTCSYVYICIDVCIYMSGHLYIYVCIHILIFTYLHVYARFLCPPAGGGSG